MKLGSNQALCCDVENLEVIGTGGFDVRIGKRGHWHNAYFCKKCKKIFYELADFGNVVQFFYTRKGTKAYQKMLANKKELPFILTYLLEINVFSPVRGGIKIGVKTLDGYRAIWIETPGLTTLKNFTYEDFIALGMDNIRKEDVKHIQNEYEHKFKELKQVVLV